MANDAFLKSKHIRALAALLLTLSLVTAVSAKDWVGNYRVGLIRPGGDRPCFLFLLQGVAQSDPVLNSPWFVIESTAPLYKDMVATVMMAKAMDRPLYVSTSGGISSACGHPTVSLVQMP